MNIIIKLSDLLYQNDNLNENRIHFLSSKRNITMDGEFTKVLFVTENFSTDSLLIEIPLQFQEDSTPYSKSDSIKKNKILKSTSLNQSTILSFAELEKKLLNYYKIYKNTNKKSIHLLNGNLMNGNVKFFTGLKFDVPHTNKIYGIKISGIWESYDSVGITYKMIEFST
jgi:hypothetical protein